ncbi:hypothetical protein TBLA_0C04190 [Henningerozyma blattae CBS 6284]|uniref:rRNA-processing protein n=1 Tax=Henningerozyma blattae (strain ATCC 34711 / CBS 6284 / DSM 70876 / NBRC 10599 / NRRL Y-10934 / UCD 77-7) TaxID=1071380 RepID=I2H1G7_HENB6|nr:hypothetical protein TBLA_0C04190 [Tetrapisispora blattae CBS 6284]CCH60219.1 hypothetical protein TBLA_0C04190 [Tetrapisispora blattae CBS 6284]
MTNLPVTETELASKTQGKLVSGRIWKHTKEPLRASSRVVKNKTLTSWDLRQKKRLEQQQFKARIQALKDEKADARKQKIQALKERREKKEEAERYERLAAKMHAKKVDRMRRREKRNKALKER